MASIRRRSYYVKVKSPDGKTWIPKIGANGKKVTKKCAVYTVEYSINGQRKVAKGYKDKGATQQLAARLEKVAARGVEGMVDEFADPMSRPLLEHVAEYIRGLHEKDDKYRYVVEHRLKIIFDGCGWTTLKDIEPNSFIRWRDAAIDEHVRRGRLGKGMSATTATQYLECVRSFCNWCAELKRLPGVPVVKRGKHGRSMMATVLNGVSKIDGKKRRNRRALSDEQIAKLLAVAGDHRAIIYRVAMSIGLRRSELAALLWGDVRLNAIRPYVQLRAEATKARRGDRLDLPPTLADDLRKLRPADVGENVAVFPAVPDIQQWKDDLAAAGIPYKDGLGRQVDFHSGTRKTLCSRLHRAGVPLAVAMRIMRHTDAKLTMIDYTDEDQIGLEAGVLAEIPPATSPTTTGGKNSKAETA